MKRYYICPIIGDGSNYNTFKPAIANTVQYYSMLDLRPDSTKKDGVCIACADTPVAINDEVSMLLTDNLADEAEAISTLLSSKLMLNLEQKTLPNILAEVLIYPQRTGYCKPLKPMLDGKYRIYLKGLIYGLPAPKYTGGTITDDFNVGDGATIGNQLTWVEAVGDFYNYNSQAWVPTGQSGVRNIAYADTAMSTADHYAQAVMNSIGAGNAGMVIRKDANATQTHYMNRATATTFYTSKNVAASITNLDSDAFTFAQGQVFKIQADSSTITSWHDATEHYSGTDTDIDDKLYTGLFAYSRYAYWDDFEAADLGVAAGHPTMKRWGGVPFMEPKGRGVW